MYTAYKSFTNLLPNVSLCLLRIGLLRLVPFAPVPLEVRCLRRETVQVQNKSVVNRPKFEAVQ